LADVGNRIDRHRIARQIAELPRERRDEDAPEDDADEQNRYHEFLFETESNERRERTARRIGGTGRDGGMPVRHSLPPSRACSGMIVARNSPQRSISAPKYGLISSSPRCSHSAPALSNAIGQ